MNIIDCRYVDAEPSWAKQLEGEMTRGRHVITFRARSPVSSISASCQMIIHVKDMEPPTVKSCPSSFTEVLEPGQSVKKLSWTEPVFSDNVKIQHVMASFLPGHYFSAGKHNILYQATDVDGNRAKCGFTVTVLAHDNHKKSGRRPTAPLAAVSSRSSSSLTSASDEEEEVFRGGLGQHHRQSFKNYAVPDDGSDSASRGTPKVEAAAACDHVPALENGKMLCKPYANNGKRCTPVCNDGHSFYQKFLGQPPIYLCLPPKRVDWEIRKFVPDCSPVHKLGIAGRDCEAGWEKRGKDTCLACPPGMFRGQGDPLCQLCPKGLYSDQFGSSKCVRCPMFHTTRGLGSRKSSQCYYHRPAARSSLLDRRRYRGGFMYYNRWMSRKGNSHEKQRKH